MCKGVIKITEFPASLNKGNFMVMDKKWYGAPKKVRFRLEISIENGHIIAFFNIAVLHAFLECSCFVTIPIVPDLILYVNSFACPSLAFLFHQALFMSFNVSETETSINLFDKHYYNMGQRQKP